MSLAKANDMLNRNYFAHISPDGKKPWDWINHDEYVYLYVAENLGMNFSTAESVHHALMLSPSHKRNILNNNYRDIGIAVLSGKIDGQETNLLVELFGSKKTTPTLIAAKPAAAVAAAQKVKQPEIKPEVSGAITEILASEIKPENNQPQITASETAATTLVAKAQPLTPIEASAVKTLEASPNQEIEHNLPPVVTYVNNAKVKPMALADRFIGLENYINYGALILMIIALLINIFVKIRIQHQSVISQTLLVIIFISGLIFLHLHILEMIKDQIAII